MKNAPTSRTMMVTIAHSECKRQIAMAPHTIRKQPTIAVLPRMPLPHPKTLPNALSQFQVLSSFIEASRNLIYTRQLTREHLTVQHPASVLAGNLLHGISGIARCCSDITPTLPA